MYHMLFYPFICLYWFYCDKGSIKPKCVILPAEGLRLLWIIRSTSYQFSLQEPPSTSGSIQRLCSICHNCGSIGLRFQSLKFGWHHKFDPNILRDSLDSQYLNDITYFFRLIGCSYFPHFRGKNIIFIRSQMTFSISRVSAFPWDLISCPGLVLSLFFTHPLH